jgi:small-conductance mechanosensitive channel
MSHLVIEILLRLAKALAAGVVGLIVLGALVGPLHVPASPELVLLCWLSGAAFILLVESSPL